jgi:hypothetical protein
MSANISFFATQNHIVNLGGSGLGFYGPSFGQSVQVGQHQDTTFITNSNGTLQGPQANNNRWTHPASASVNGASSISLLAVPNFLSTLNIRFTNSTPVRTQNARLYIFDRSNINNNPSGVTCRVAQVVHPDPVQNVNGSGSSVWETPRGSSFMNLIASPGMSGNRPNGASTTSARHDWYTALSPSPDSVGSKELFGLYFECEYL